MYRLHDLNQLYSDVAVLTAPSKWNTATVAPGSSRSPPSSHSPSPVTLGAPFPPVSGAPTTPTSAHLSSVGPRAQPLSRIVLGRHTQLPDSHRIRHIFVSRRHVMIQAMTLQLLIWKIANQRKKSERAAQVQALFVKEKERKGKGKEKKKTSREFVEEQHGTEDEEDDEESVGISPKGTFLPSYNWLGPTGGLLEEPQVYDMVVPGFQHDAMCEFLSTGKTGGRIMRLDAEGEVFKEDLDAALVQEAKAVGKKTRKKEVLSRREGAALAAPASGAPGNDKEGDAAAKPMSIVSRSNYLRFLREQLTLLTAQQQHEEDGTITKASGSPKASGAVNARTTSPAASGTVLQGPNGMPEHVVVVMSVLGGNPVYVNGRRVPQGRSVLLQLDDVIEFLESGYEKVFRRLDSGAAATAAPHSIDGNKRDREGGEGSEDSKAHSARKGHRKDGPASKNRNAVQQDRQNEIGGKDEGEDGDLFPMSCSRQSGRLPGYCPLPVYMLGRRTPSPETSTASRRSIRR